MHLRFPESLLKCSIVYMCICNTQTEFMHRNCILSEVGWGEFVAELDGKLVPTLVMRDSHTVSALPAAFDLRFCLAPWSGHFVRLKCCSSNDCPGTRPFTSVLCPWTICWQILESFFLSITESQNNWGWQGLLCPFAPPPNSSRDTQSRGPRPMASEHLQRGDPTVSRQPVPVSQHGTAQQCSEGAPGLWFVFTASCPGTGGHWKEPGSTLFVLSLQVSIGIGKIPPEPFLLQDEQSQLAQILYICQVHQSLHHFHGPKFGWLR